MRLTSFRQLVARPGGGHAEGLGEAAVRGRRELGVVRALGRARAPTRAPRAPVPRPPALAAAP